MLDPAQRPAEPLPSEPPSETVGGLDIAALLQGWVPRGRTNGSTATTSKGSAPESDPATLEQESARKRQQDNEKAEKERKKRADRLNKGPPTQGASSSPSQPKSSSGKSGK